MQDKEDLKVLASTGSEAHGQLLVAALAARGIDAHASGGAVSDFKVPVAAKVEIFVRPEDWDRARQALRDILDGEEEIDWSHVDVGEPE